MVRHKHQENQEIITETFCKSLYLPSYLPFLDPIKEFKENLKTDTQRNRYTIMENLIKDIK
ncbi:hypothetical protein CLU79DRAFT_711101 [Phycomyces nitens]|nr:hypothetical protein CLU79DRAFT_711101 [Phycomyces nitens]